jgi:hypothetical protein
VEAVVELLWWEDCPSWERTLAILREQMRAAGIDEEALTVTEIETEEDARRHGFPGSPTIRIRGRDILPPGPDQPIGLTCRVYRQRDGRVSPLPDPEDIREALKEVNR